MEKHIGSREGETLAWCLPQPSPPRRPAVITVPQILLLEIYSQLNPKAQRAAGGKGVVTQPHYGAPSSTTLGPHMRTALEIGPPF